MRPAASACSTPPCWWRCRSSAGKSCWRRWWCSGSCTSWSPSASRSGSWAHAKSGSACCNPGWDGVGSAKPVRPGPGCGHRSRAGNPEAGNGVVICAVWSFVAELPHSLISALPLTSNDAMAGILLRSMLSVALVAGALAGISTSAAQAQTAGGYGPLQISWEVRNRFRLFREERDFLLHAESGRGRSVLASEQVLAIQSDGRGWARNTVNRLCIDLAGRVSEPCTRDNVKESYLPPIDHPVVIRLTGPVPVGATCAWTVDDGDGPQTSAFDCAEPVNLRVRYGRTTVVTADVSSSDGSQRVFTEI